MNLPVPTDPEGTFVGDVHVVIDGDSSAPAVALIHGVPGSTRDFRYLGPALAEVGLCAVRFDMPGFGRTPLSAFPSLSIPNRAAFVRGTMRALGFPRFAVAGHSFGGAVALMGAALFPDDVTAFVGINSIGPRRHRGYGAPAVALRMTARALRLPVVGKPVHAAMARAYAARGLKSDIGLGVEVMEHHLAFVGNLVFRELTQAAAQVRVPAMVVSSRDDRLVEPASSFALARAFTNAPLVTHRHVESGGHFLQKHEARAIARWVAARPPLSSRSKSERPR